MPTLSALPWEEREKILSSMGNDDKSSVAGSEEAEPSAPPNKPLKPITRHKTPQEPLVKKGRRSRRCGQCPGCQVPEDCGVCTNCLDKPKFGGRNIKKQCCKMRKCQNLQWMPSKAFLQKEAKASKKEKKKYRVQEKDSQHVSKSQSSEANQKTVVTPLATISREESTLRKIESLPLEEMPPQQECSGTPQDTALPAATFRKERKQQQTSAPAEVSIAAPEQPSESLDEDVENCTANNSEVKKVLPMAETGSEAKQLKKQILRYNLPSKQKLKEKEKLLSSKAENSTLNVLGPSSNENNTKHKVPSDGVHRIRVDFKEDYSLENIWDLGGLSILTSVPIMPRVVCFLCASSGHVEVICLLSGLL
uniref:CXXC-type domain-containing protein n=1 Tax=Erpetoichthys calabaricus TaxID=27687 RepID=A0A8C4X8Q6_ERPCA